MAFSFGTSTGAASTVPSLFGSTSTPAQSTGFSFGTPGTSTAGTGATSGFSLGSFGTAATTTTASTGFGFGLGTGTATTSAPSLFGGFGASSTSSTPFSFNTATTTSASTGFGGFGTGTSAFGTSTANTGFGTGTFGSTGTNTFGAAGTFGQNANVAGAGQTQLSAEEHKLALVAMAVSLPQIYGDERDSIIAKWNQLQAYWGTGKGYSKNGEVELKPDNPYCRFKALGYNLIPKGNNDLGQVALTLGRKESEVTAVQQQIVDTMHKILGSKPTLNVCVEGVKSLPEDKTEIVIYVLERPATGPAKRIPANDLANYLNQPAQKQQITSQLNVENVLAKVGWSNEQLKEYLDKAPAGIDPLLWQQAKLDNPDPDRYIPVPMIGFKELQRRLRHQAEQTKAYQQRMDVIAGDLTALQTQHSTMLSKLEDYKRKYLELGHRLLKVIVKQEIHRKMGYGIQVEEETLKVQLEQLQGELNHPTQFKGRLNEVMSQMRMQMQLASGRPEQSYNMDTQTQLEIKQILKQQQEGLQHLINIIKEDATDLQLIEQGIAKTHN